MPFTLAGIGLILVMTGINNTYSQFGTLLQGDISSGYLKWAAAIVIIGALGYVKDLRTLSTAFLTLILVAIFLSNKGGVFSQLTSAVNQEAGT